MGANMANVTRIKAKDSNRSDNSSADNSDAEISRKVSIKAKNSENKKAKVAEKKAIKEKAKEIRKEKKEAEKKEIPAALKPLWYISAPFRAIGRYIRDSFRELRQVRWPNRKTTWKITLSVIIYVLIIGAFIMLLDVALRVLFDNLLGGNK